MKTEWFQNRHGTFSYGIKTQKDFQTTLYTRYMRRTYCKKKKVDFTETYLSELANPRIFAVIQFHWSNTEWLKGSQLGIFPHKPLCTLNLNFTILNKRTKKLKLFSVGVYELFEPIVLRKKWDGFCSFQEEFLEKPIFEYNTICDFTLKNAKFGGGICI